MGAAPHASWGLVPIRLPPSASTVVPMPVTASGPVVLLVEDNASMRALIRSLVTDVSSAVHECADGETALELYQRVRPDLVLMDVQMAGMDGIAATRALRRSDPNARIIIVTEHSEAQYRSAAAAAGASGFVLKDDLLALPRLVEQGRA
jgi:CheY-like chemotaxis protein